MFPLPHHRSIMFLLRKLGKSQFDTGATVMLDIILVKPAICPEQ